MKREYSRQDGFGSRRENCLILALALSCLAGAGVRAFAQETSAGGSTTGSPAAGAAAAPNRGAESAEPARPRVELSAFEWLAGDWVIDDGKQRVEETWTRPAPDMMIGMSRTLDATRTTAFEFMRIAARPDGVFYIAQPRGKPPVEFPLQSWDGNAAIFVNDGSSDHLKRIVYRRDGANMTASIEGANKGQDFTESYRYRRPVKARAPGGR